MDEWKTRWRKVRPFALTAVAILALKLLYFAAIQQRVPDQILDNPEGLTIEFSVDQSAVLTLESCVSGSWSVTGDTDEIRVNGGTWSEPASGQYEICNRPDLSPTLKVRLPSTAIASYQLEVKAIFGDGLQAILFVVLLFCAMYLIGVPTWSNRTQALVIVVAHLGLVLWYQATTELSIDHTHAWGHALHTLPMADLRHDLWQSFLHLHNQPPLFSVYGITLDLLSAGSLKAAMFAVHVSLGILMCVMSFYVLLHLARNKTFALFTALLLALNPAYFFYEAFALYTMLSAFLILAAAFCLLQFGRAAAHRYVFLFMLCLNLLILTRSVYHIAILIPALLLATLLSRQGTIRMIAVSLLIGLLSLAWYGKNLVVNGSFSSASGLGMSLWKVARDDYDADELTDLYKDGVLTDRTVIWFFTFLPPSAYPGYAPADNGIPILSGDNSNNAVYLELQQLYLDNSLRLIRHDPWRYFRGALRAYGYYSCPSSTFESMSKNLATFPASHQAASVQLFHMQSAADAVARLLGMSRDEFGVCSNLYFIMPLILFGCPLYLLAIYRLRLSAWRQRISQDAVLVYIWAMVAYTAVITSLLETPENSRYKFMIEIPLFIFIAVVGYRLLRLLQMRLMKNGNFMRMVR